MHQLSSLLLLVGVCFTLPNPLSPCLWLCLLEALESLSCPQEHRRALLFPYTSFSLGWGRNPGGRTPVGLAGVTGTSLHRSLGAEVGHNDWSRLGQLAILQPMIMAREVKSYKQKAAPIWAPWLGQKDGEGRRVLLPEDE